MTTTSDTLQFRGVLSIPSETDRHDVTLLLADESESATLHFDEPVAGSDEWRGQNVQVMDRPKYQEIQFTTFDLPKDTVRLTWKLNRSKLDNTIAGVVVARPNTVRVRGEKGFILTQV